MRRKIIIITTTTLAADSFYVCEVFHFFRRESKQNCSKFLKNTWGCHHVRNLWRVKDGLTFGFSRTPTDLAKSTSECTMCVLVCVCVNGCLGLFTRSNFLFHAGVHLSGPSAIKIAIFTKRAETKESENLHQCKCVSVCVCKCLLFLWALRVLITLAANLEAYPQISIAKLPNKLPINPDVGSIWCDMVCDMRLSHYCHNGAKCGKCIGASVPRCLRWVCAIRFNGGLKPIKACRAASSQISR